MQKTHFRTLIFGILVILFSCKTQESTYQVKTSQYTFKGDSIQKNVSSTLSFIEPYRDSLKRSMNFPLVYATQALTKELPEGNLGNYCADASLRQATIKCKQLNLEQPDFCFLNHGGLRASLPQGAITVGNVFELMPFENELVYLTVSSATVDSILTWIAVKGGAPIAGIKFHINNKRAEQVTIQNQLIKNESHYKIITSDYLANGGDGLYFLKLEKAISLGIKVRDAFIQDLQNIGSRKDSLSVQKDGRLIKIQ
ncbi:MAG: 5'-nucleotidase C-terminal domain-containing protein [Bacteroidetes bacterium]|nr:5'-nucleotidase C-terminal domain-containing protein [Bacteroidota bacterium]